jgi:cytochrome c6
MTKTMRSKLVLAAMIAAACTMGFAQAGEATYKSKCQMCHGSAGTPSPGMAKMMGIKPTSDPDIKKLTVEQIEATVKNGKGKMKPVTGLTDAQVKEVAEYFKTLK